MQQSPLRTRKMAPYSERRGAHRNRATEKSRKREEGEARNARWAELSPTHKLAELSKRRGESRKQAAKLRALIVPKLK